MPLWPGSCAESWCSVLVCVPQTHAKEVYLALISFISWGRFGPLLLSAHELPKGQICFESYLPCLLCSGSHYRKRKRSLCLRSHSLAPVTLQSFNYHSEHWSEWILSCINKISSLWQSCVFHPIYVWWPSYNLKLDIVKKLV